MKACSAVGLFNCSLISILLFISSSCGSKADLVIKNITVIDVEHGVSLPGKTVSIKNENIDGMFEGDVEGEKEIDGSGKYLIPGLWDMHTHVTIAGEEGLPLFLRSGITSLRDMGGNIELIKKFIENGEKSNVPLPNIYYAGAVLESQRFLDHIVKIDSFLITQGIETVWKTYKYRMNPVAVKMPDDVDKALDSLKLQGIKFVKYRTLETKDVYYRIAKKSKELRLPFGGHFPSHGITLEEASDLGQNSFEHMYALTEFIGEYDSIQLNNLVNKLRTNNSYLVPTITTEKYRTLPDRMLEARFDSLLKKTSSLNCYGTDTLLSSFSRDWKIRKLEHTMMPANQDDGKGFENNIRILKLLERGGVKLMTGTDQGAFMVMPGVSLYEELENFVDLLGVSPGDALKSATYYPAEFFGVLSTEGTIEKGKIANLVILDGNPLEDIQAIRKVNQVIMHGALVNRNN